MYSDVCVPCALKNSVTPCDDDDDVGVSVLSRKMPDVRWVMVVR